MNQKIDMRGEKCPRPVIETKKALESMADGVLEVTVDNEAARDNILRFVAFKGFEAAASSETEGEYVITIEKGEMTDEEEHLEGAAPAARKEPEIVCDASRERVLLITTARIGGDNDGLARELMDSFLDVLTQATRLPEKMFLINAGVTLAVEGSPVLDALQDVEEKGVKIFSCARCLEYLDLKKKLAVGQITNMYEIVETLTNAASVIRL